MPAGNSRYFVEAGSAFHASQLYSGVDCPGGQDDVFPYSCPDPALGTPVDVEPGEDRGGLDFSLKLDRSPCQSSALRLCLGGGRFSVTALLGGLPPAIHYVTELTRDAGFLDNSFGLPALVKVLDGCQDFGQFWMFAEGLSPYRQLRVRDRFAATSRIYTLGSEEESPSLSDLQAFATCDAPAPRRELAEQESPPPPPEPAGAAASGCGGDPAPNALCLANRFRVEVEWETASGERGPGRPLAVDADSGAWTFFGPNNVELLVKIIDDCAQEFVPRY